MTDVIKAVKVSENDTSRWNKLLFSTYYSAHRASMTDQFLKSTSGRENETFIFVKDGIDIAGAHYSTVRRCKKLFKVAEINSGIVFKESPDPYLIELILDDFIYWAEQKRCVYMSITPWLPKEIDGKTTSYVDMFHNVAEKTNLTMKASPITETLIIRKNRTLGNYEKVQTQRNTDTQDPFRA